MGIEELRNNEAVYNLIDWDLTPEEAVSLYLEWGNSWNHGMRMIKSKNDESYYFVVNTWGEHPLVYLVRRNMEGSEELAEFRLPPGLEEHFNEYTSRHKAIWAPSPEVRHWLEELLGGQPWEEVRRSA